MRWLHKPSTRASRKSRALGVELLDDRRLLSATPLGAGSAGYPNPLEDDDLGPIGPVAQLGEITDSFYADVANSIRSGALGYPAPDDDGGWGPLGPVVRDAVTAATVRLGYSEPSRVIVTIIQPPDFEYPTESLSSTNLFDYNPNPEDDGDLGPIGPVVHVFVADSFSNVSEQSSAGRGSFYPNPEDDDGGGWGPIGPVVHVFVADSFSNVSEQSDMVARSGGGSFYPNPEDDDGGGWGPIGPVVHVFVADSFSNLTEQSDIVARSGGGSFYPNPEDDDGGGWGPIGPVINDLVDADRLVVIASPESSLAAGFYPNPEEDDDGGPRATQSPELESAIHDIADNSASNDRSAATDNVAIRDRAFASVETGVARRSLRG